MSNLEFTGWDIGGAHLKVANVDSTGRVNHVEQVSTPLWQGIDKLEAALPRSVSCLPGKNTLHAVTMTAELVDIFNNREEGIEQLIAISEKYLGSQTRFYATGNEFLEAATARQQPERVASANWYASAALVANKIEDCIFVDIGSTTTDIIPVTQHRLSHLGHDDHTRMRHDELIYTGVVRTPLMALTQRVPFNGEWQTIAAEYFSTTADVYRVLGYLGHEDDLMESPDGNAKDVPCSIRRLGRMLGLDVKSPVPGQQWTQLANYFAEVQLQMMTDAISRVMTRLNQPAPKLVGAGVGRFLVKQLAERLRVDYRDFSDLIETDVSFRNSCNTCAPAVSLAILNQQSRPQ